MSLWGDGCQFKGLLLSCLNSKPVYIIVVPSLALLSTSSSNSKHNIYLLVTSGFNYIMIFSSSVHLSMPCVSLGIFFLNR
jgi:hypothetical protein